MIYFIAICLLIIVVTLGFWAFKQFFDKGDDSWKSEVRVKLLEIRDNTNLNSESRLMQLDKLLEHCLQKKFRNNLSLGGNLKSKSSQFLPKDLNQIWLAHKTRNRIAHDINFNADNNYRDLEQAVTTLDLACKKWSL